MDSENFERTKLSFKKEIINEDNSTPDEIINDVITYLSEFVRKNKIKNLKRLKYKFSFEDVNESVLEHMVKGAENEA